MNPKRKILIAILIFNRVLSVNCQSILFENDPVNFTKKAIEIELTKYPTGLLEKYLEEIVVVQTEKYCGLAFSARVAPAKIHLNDNSRCKVDVTIHHEISSLFLHRYDELAARMRDKFIELNGSEYSYTYQIDHSKVEAGTKLADYFYSRKYAMYSFENDYNVIAESLFVNGHEVIQLMNERPNLPISKKIKLVLDHYNMVSKEFTLSYFERQKI